MSAISGQKSQPIGDPFRLKNPIVLIHGLGAKSAYGPFDYFHWLPRQLRSSGNTLFIANLTSWQSVEHRAQELKRQIEAALPEGQLNLIGHSMGGIDARYITSTLGLGERVVSVTTVGTPNYGCGIGDVALGLVPAGALEASEKFIQRLDFSHAGFRQITKKGMAELAPKLIDVPGVAYFSASSVIPRDRITQTSLPMFWLPTRILNNLEGENDGFVSLESAQYGTHICTHLGDHYGQIGQFLGRSRGLNFMQMYQEIFARLRAEGF